MKKTTCLLAILALTSVTLFAQSEKKSDGDKFTIKNTVSTFNLEEVDSTEVGYQFWFVDKTYLDGRTLKMSVVEPQKATHAPRSHEEDEFFFVLEGTAEFYLDGETTEAGPYSSFYCPPYSKHGIRNVGDTELKYLVIKKYLSVD